MTATHQGVLSKQVNLFFLALGFFTRLPIPKNTPYSEALLNQSSRYFSLVGYVIAGILLIALSGALLLWPSNIALVIMMVLSLMLTGAFHEDGLADMSDGMGGGFNVEKRLSIMKDSRIGTYGSCALVLTLLLKFLLLEHLLSHIEQFSDFALLLFFSYGFSRAIAASLIFDMTYVSDLDKSKSKPLAQQQKSKDLLILSIIASVPLLIFSWQLSLCLMLVLIVFRQCFKAWLLRRLGGYNGDCLGGAQQISELLIYLVISAAVSFQDLNLTLSHLGARL